MTTEQKKSRKRAHKEALRAVLVLETESREGGLIDAADTLRTAGVELATILSRYPDWE